MPGHHALVRSCALLAICTAPLFACSRERPEQEKNPPSSLKVLPEPGASAKAPLAAASPSPTPAATPPKKGRCPLEMVVIAKKYCIDRYESAIVDGQGRQASPYYPILDSGYDKWIRDRRAEADKLLALDDRGSGGEGPAEGGLVASGPADAGVPLIGGLVPGKRGPGWDLPFPELPDWQKDGAKGLKAVSKQGMFPNAYLSMYSVSDACKAAGKRLCSLEEWQTACRGEKNTRFPWGDEYKAGRCNVFREEHPGHLIYDRFTVGMLDPRMNLVASGGKPLLRNTGDSPECKSTWGDDAVHDMVGNLDEWIDDPKGTFVGGFFSRNTKKGCDQVIEGHTAGYTDYSTGGRCCRDIIED